MKPVLLFVSLIFINITLFAQNKKQKPEDQIEQYWFVMLKTGPEQYFDSTQKAKLFAGHMDNINKLYYDGILKVAGPFGKNSFDWRGIFILDCKTQEEAERLVQGDPAVEAGLLTADIAPWFSAPIGSFKHGKPVKE
ncbi:MAG: hypothetical protein IPJ81_12485 [Chitinophagaceae bacterium]|nr:hypothetical protein [Chitinophagaceae bacterium]